MTAARRVLPDEIARRVSRLESDLDEVFRLDGHGVFYWRGNPVADLVAGDVPWRPDVRVRESDMLEPPQRDRVQKRLKTWLDVHLEAVIPQLLQLARSDLSGGARGIVFQVLEGLGNAPAEGLRAMVKELDEQGRKDLARVGIRLGTENLYIPQLLKPKPVAMRGLLWSVFHGRFPEEGLPPEGRVQVVRRPETPTEYDIALGYQRLGGRAIRIDMVERIAALIRQAARNGPFAINPDMLSLAGVDHETFAAILNDLGYRKVGERPADQPAAAQPAQAGDDAGAAPTTEDAAAPADAARLSRPRARLPRKRRLRTRRPRTRSARPRRPMRPCRKASARRHPRRRRGHRCERRAGGGQLGVGRSTARRSGGDRRDDPGDRRCPGRSRNRPGWRRGQTG